MHLSQRLGVGGDGELMGGGMGDGGDGEVGRGDG